MSIRSFVVCFVKRLISTEGFLPKGGGQREGEGDPVRQKEGRMRGYGEVGGVV